MSSASTKQIYPAIPDPSPATMLSTVQALAQAVRLLTAQVGALQNSNQKLAAQLTSVSKRLAAGGL